MTADVSPRARRYLLALSLALAALAALAWVRVGSALYDAWLRGWIEGIHSVQCAPPPPPPDVLL